jgi:AcrR family transcriptional regulator
MPRILTPNDVSDFRNRLCDVACDLFAEVGQAGFNMRELAKRLGVSAMTPYRYFDDKDTILSEVRARAFAGFADWLEDQHARFPGRDGLARAYAQFVLEHQAQYRLMFDLTQPQGHGLPALLEAEWRVRAAISRFANDAVDDPDLSGLVLWSALHGVASLHLAGKLSGGEFESVLARTIRPLASASKCAASTESRANQADAAVADFTAAIELARFRSNRLADNR